MGFLSPEGSTFSPFSQLLAVQGTHTVCCFNQAEINGAPGITLKYTFQGPWRGGGGGVYVSCRYFLFNPCHLSLRLENAHVAMSNFRAKGHTFS